jgi:UDP-galactopyranose mutase
MLAGQVDAATRRLGFKPGLIWTYLASDAVEDLITDMSDSSTALVYYCAADFELFASHPARLAISERSIAGRADVVFATCDQLADRLRPWNSNLHVFPCGVDLSLFTAPPSPMSPPGAAALERLPRPVIGYVGGLHVSLDLELVIRSARARPAWSWVFVGRPSRPIEELAALPNVHTLGQQPHAELPEYIRRFDVCIVPYVRGRLTDTVVPTKINEYLAVGKPVVATDIPNVVTFERRHEVLEVTPVDPGAFLAGIERALTATDPRHVRHRQEVAAEADWPSRLENMCAIIERSLSDRRRTPGSATPEGTAGEGCRRPQHPSPTP